MGAFATGSPSWVSEFHLSPANTPTVELLLARPPPREGGPGDCADTLRFPLGIAASWALRFKRGPPSRGRRHKSTLAPARPPRTCRPGTFNHSNNLMSSLPWYYRACWHQNLAQIAFVSLFTPDSSHGLPHGRPINHLGLRPLDSFRTCC